MLDIQYCDHRLIAVPSNCSEAGSHQQGDTVAGRGVRTTCWRGKASYLRGAGGKQSRACLTPVCCGEKGHVIQLQERTERESDPVKKQSGFLRTSSEKNPWAVGDKDSSVSSLAKSAMLYSTRFHPQIHVLSTTVSHYTDLSNASQAEPCRGIRHGQL